MWMSDSEAFCSEAALAAGKERPRREFPVGHLTGADDDDDDDDDDDNFLVTWAERHCPACACDHTPDCLQVNTHGGLLAFGAPWEARAAHPSRTQIM